MKFETEKAKFWIDKEDIERTAMEQIDIVSQHPKIYKHISIMPDVHAGIGCTIGSVIPLVDAIIPSCVGVDIGCGMCSLETNLTMSDVSTRLEEIHSGISRRIPVGFNHRSEGQVKIVESVVDKEFREEMEFYESKYQGSSLVPQLGTLGGGNHFIEMQVDQKGKIWMMIHSGSRNIGLKIATTYMKTAKETCEDKVPEHLEYFEASSDLGKLYIKEMKFAVEFAKTNRFIMMECVKIELEHLFASVAFENIINIPHNYSSLEKHFDKDVWVHRKGATKAISTELGIIPGSMGTTSYIVRGKNNPDSFMSCSHGAGRVMSRTKAKGKFNRRKNEYKSDGVLSVDDFSSDMTGVFSKTIDREHLDEAPRAYKDIFKVIESQKDLIEIVEELTPVLNIKG